MKNKPPVRDIRCGECTFRMVENELDGTVLHCSNDRCPQRHVQWDRGTLIERVFHRDSKA